MDKWKQNGRVSKCREVLLIMGMFSVTKYVVIVSERSQLAALLHSKVGKKHQVDGSGKSVYGRSHSLLVRGVAVLKRTPRVLYARLLCRKKEERRIRYNFEFDARSRLSRNGTKGALFARGAELTIRKPASHNCRIANIFINIYQT